MKLGGECRHHPNRKKTNQFVVSWSWWPPHQLNTFLKMKPFLIQKIPPCHLSELPQKVRDCLVATQFSAILIWANQNNFSYNSQTRIRTLYFGGIPFLNYHMLHHLDSFGPKMASLIGICPEFVDTENWRSFRIFALTPKCLTNKIPRKEQALPHCIHHFLRSFFFKATFFLGGTEKGVKTCPVNAFFFPQIHVQSVNNYHTFACLIPPFNDPCYRAVFHPILLEDSRTSRAFQIWSFVFSFFEPEKQLPNRKTILLQIEIYDQTISKEFKYQNTEILSNPWWTVSCLVSRLLISESFLGPPRMPVSTRSITV